LFLLILRNEVFFLVGASAQFYTVTQGKEFSLQYESKTPLSAENKRDTAIVLNETLSIDTLTNQNTEETASRPYVQKSNEKTYLNEGRNTRHKEETIEAKDDNLPTLTIPNLYAEIKRNGILYPDIVLAQAILETGWFRSNACRKKHNLFGLTNPRTGKYYEFDHWTDSVKAYYTKVQYHYKGSNKEREHGVCFVFPSTSSFALQPRILASSRPMPSTKICRLCTDFDRLSTKFDTLSLFNIRGGVE